MSRKQTPLRPYFEKMADIGKALNEGEIKRSKENVELVLEQEEILAQENLRAVSYTHLTLPTNREV